jgi:hypothetical protein
LKYLRFLPSDITIDCDGNIFLESDKERLLSFIEKSNAKGENESTNDDDENDIEKLRKVMKLTEGYISPEGGIEGMLGSLPDLQELMLADREENKKRWAW